MYESQKPLVGDWPSSAWGQGELTATGWQLNDIRRMTTECPQKTLERLHMPRLLDNDICQKKWDYQGLAAHADKYRGALS